MSIAKQVLVYFPIDNTLGVVAPNMIVTNDMLDIGVECKVKVGTKRYEARIIEIGKHLVFISQY